MKKNKDLLMNSINYTLKHDGCHKLYRAATNNDKRMINDLADPIYMQKIIRQL